MVIFIFQGEENGAIISNIFENIYHTPLKTTPAMSTTDIAIATAISVRTTSTSTTTAATKTTSTTTTTVAKTATKNS
jgi:hypothetical protein